MTKIKLCGISRMCDVDTINILKPEYIGFVFAKGYRRFVPYELAKQIKNALSEDIKTVGVFVDETVEQVAKLLDAGIIDIAQLHGSEDESYIRQLRNLIAKPVIKAFCIKEQSDIIKAKSSIADYVLLDAGTGSGKSFDRSLIKEIDRPFFLAGGLNAGNVVDAINEVHPYAVDVSSGIETEGIKDKDKMKTFVDTVRSIQ